MFYREGRVTQVAKGEMVQMVLQEVLGMMVPLVTQVLKDRLVIKVVMQLLKIALNAHHTVTSKATEVVPVHQGILASLAGQANQVLVVNLVDAFLDRPDLLEEMVSQVMME